MHSVFTPILFPVLVLNLIDYAGAGAVFIFMYGGKITQVSVPSPSSAINLLPLLPNYCTLGLSASTDIFPFYSFKRPSKYPPRQRRYKAMAQTGKFKQHGQVCNQQIKVVFCKMLWGMRGMNWGVGVIYLVFMTGRRNLVGQRCILRGVSQRVSFFVSRGWKRGEKNDRYV